MSEQNKLYSVVFECEFVKECFCKDDIYSKGETDWFSIILTADTFSIALVKAFAYVEENFPNCDVSIKSIISL